VLTKPTKPTESGKSLMAMAAHMAASPKGRVFVAAHVEVG
jgi:hypothetical protein